MLTRLVSSRVSPSVGVGTRSCRAVSTAFPQTRKEEDDDDHAGDIEHDHYLARLSERCSKHNIKALLLG